MADKEQEQKSADQSGQPQIRLEARKIYIKDVSYESPQSPKIFTQGDVSPQIDVQMTLQHKQIENQFFEVVLNVTVTSKLEEAAVFLIEVQQAGIFEIQAPDDKQMEMLKEIACPNMLLPFARETVADLISKGGFPQLLLNPINFEALYLRKKEKEKQSQQTPTSDSVN